MICKKSIDHSQSYLENNQLKLSTGHSPLHIQLYTPAIKYFSHFHITLLASIPLNQLPIYFKDLTNSMIKQPS